MKIIPSITTSNFEITDIQLKEIQNSDLREFGLFLTGMHFKEDRMNLMKKLKDLEDCVIPLVHIRVDSTPEELEFCLENFKTEWFNLHGIHKDVLINNQELYEYRHYILAENSRILTKLQLEHFAGICLDLSHFLEDLINRRNHVHEIKESLKMFPVYCNHISAVRKDQKNWYSEHIGNYSSDFNYLKEIPKEYWGSCCSCMELENSIKKQMEYIEYIKTIV